MGRRREEASDFPLVEKSNITGAFTRNLHASSASDKLADTSQRAKEQ